jgi:hypothetical protein
MALVIISIFFGSLAGSASAQIDPGVHDVYVRDGTGGGPPKGGRETSAGKAFTSASIDSDGWMYSGVVSVPERGEAKTSYRERWSLFGNQTLGTLLRDKIVEIVPRQGTLSSPSAVGDLPSDAQHVDLLAEESTPSSQELTGVLSAGAGPARGECNIVVVYQCIECGAPFDARLLRPVGLIRNFLKDDGDSEQEWLLSSDYVYPSPSSHVVTQLWPSSDPCSEALALFRKKVNTLIQVRQSFDAELGPAEATANVEPPSSGPESPDPGCHVGFGSQTASSIWRSPGVLFSIGAVLVIWRRRQRRLS